MSTLEAKHHGPVAKRQNIGLNWGEKLSAALGSGLSQQPAVGMWDVHRKSVRGLA